MAENMLRKLAKTWPDSNTGSNALDKIYLEAKRV